MDEITQGADVKIAAHSIDALVITGFVFGVFLGPTLVVWLCAAAMDAMFPELSHYRP